MNPLVPLALAALLTSQADDRIATAHEQASRCAEAVITGEFETVVDLTHPKIIGMLGGREKMIATMKEGLEGLKKRGITMKESKAEKPEKLAKSGDSLYCVVPTTNVIEVPQGTLTSKAFLVGLSSDEGKTWTFIDGAPGAEKIRELFPDIPAELKLPEREKPTLEPKAEE
jgi:hypothetical protein